MPGNGLAGVGLFKCTALAGNNKVSFVFNPDAEEFVPNNALADNEREMEGGSPKTAESLEATSTVGPYMYTLTEGYIKPITLESKNNMFETINWSETVSIFGNAAKSACEQSAVEVSEHMKIERNISDSIEYPQDDLIGPSMYTVNEQCVKPVTETTNDGDADRYWEAKSHRFEYDSDGTAQSIAYDGDSEHTPVCYGEHDEDEEDEEEGTSEYEDSIATGDYSPESESQFDIARPPFHDGEHASAGMPGNDLAKEVELVRHDRTIGPSDHTVNQQHASAGMPGNDLANIDDLARPPFHDGENTYRTVPSNSTDQMHKLDEIGTSGFEIGPSVHTVNQPNTEWDTSSVDESLADISDDEKGKDSLRNAMIERCIDGQFFQGRVEDIEVGNVSGKRLYRIWYNDGDVEHYTAEQVALYRRPANTAIENVYLADWIDMSETELQVDTSPKSALQFDLARH